MRTDRLFREWGMSMDTPAGRHYGGPEWKESGEKKAERILTEEPGRRRLGPDDLPGRRKGAPEKLEIAKRLRAETTMTWARIARRLGMGV